MTENRLREAPAIVELSWFDVMQAGAVTSTRLPIGSRKLLCRATGAGGFESPLSASESQELAVGGRS